MPSNDDNYVIIIELLSNCMVKKIDIGLKSS